MPFKRVDDQDCKCVGENLSVRRPAPEHRHGFRCSANLHWPGNEDVTVTVNAIPGLKFQPGPATILITLTETDYNCDSA